MAVFCTRQQGEHLGFLARAERIARSMSRPTSSVVAVRVVLLALNRPNRDANHPTGGAESCTGDLGLAEGDQDHGSCSSRVSSSSSSSSAWSVFEHQQCGGFGERLVLPCELSLERADPLHGGERSSSFLGRRPVSIASCRALTASLPVKRATIFA
jgi:hypothetical protein